MLKLKIIIREEKKNQRNVYTTDSETSLKTQDACSTDSGKCSWITEGQLCTFSPLLTSSPWHSLQSQQAPVRASGIWPTNLLLLYSSQHQQPQGSWPAITLPPEGQGDRGSQPAPLGPAEGRKSMDHPQKASPQCSLTWNRAAVHTFHWQWCSLLLSPSAQQGSGPGFQCPCSFAEARGIKGNSDSCCRIIGARQAGEEQPEVMIEAVMPSLQQPLLGNQSIPGIARQCSGSEGGSVFWQGQETHRFALLTKVHRRVCCSSSVAHM